LRKSIIGLGKAYSILALSGVVLITGAASPQERLISVEQARQALRQFFGVPNLELLEPTQDTGYIGEDKKIPVYNFKTPDRSFYRVDATSGSVLSVYSPTHHEPATKGPALPLERLRALAVEYARRSTPKFDPSEYQLQDTLKDGVYGFTFVRPELPNGLQWPCEVRGGLDAATGRIRNFSQGVREVPPAAHATPKISAAQALQIAMKRLGVVELVEHPKANRYSLSVIQGRLAWGGGIKGLDANGRVVGEGIIVDALTGDIVEEVSLAATMESPRPLRGRIMVNTRMLKDTARPWTTDKGSFVPVELIRAFGAEVREHGKGIQVSGNVSVTLPSSRLASRSGLQWLPAEVLQQAFPGLIGAVEADAARNALHIVCLTPDMEGWIYEHHLPLVASLEEEAKRSQRLFGDLFRERLERNVPRYRQIEAALRSAGWLEDAPVAVSKGKPRPPHRGLLIGFIAFACLLGGGMVWRSRHRRHQTT
jgi:hypothetical protein